MTCSQCFKTSASKNVLLWNAVVSMLAAGKKSFGGPRFDGNYFTIFRLSNEGIPAYSNFYTIYLGDDPAFIKRRN